MNATYARILLPIVLLAFLSWKAPTLWRAGWSHDDLMNCYRILDTSWTSLFRDMLLFWQPSPLYRPFGEAFYKLLWPAFGFDPLPWRIAFASLLIANALLVGHIAARLTGSFAAGLAAAALMSYHPNWTHLYLNTGTIFEVLAFTLVWTAFALWLHFPDHIVAPLFLLWLGVNTKESALLLLPLITLHEVLWHRRLPWRFLLTAAFLIIPFLAGRVFGSGGLASIGNYRPQYTFSTYQHNLMIYGKQWLAGPLLLLLLIPLLVRTKLSLLALLWFPLAILPLAFIETRALDSVYLACAALPLLAAALVARYPRCLVLTLGLAFLPAQSQQPGWDAETQDIQAFQRELARVLPTPPRNQTIQFRSEPFPAEYPWASTFLTRLHFRDTSIPVIGAHSGQACPGQCLSLEWRDGRLHGIDGIYGSK